jgi:hypothetical protein
MRSVEVEEVREHVRQAALRFVVGPSSQLAQQAATTDAAAHAKEAERVAAHRQRMAARWGACSADAEAAIAEDEGHRGKVGEGAGPGALRPCPIV